MPQDINITGQYKVNGIPLQSGSNIDKDASVIITPIPSLNTQNTFGTNGFMTITNPGSGSPVINNANYYAMLPKNVVRTATSSGSTAGIYSNVTSAIAPTLAYSMSYGIKFGVDQYISTMRAFIGFSSLTSAPANVEPNTLTNTFGICKPSTSDNFHIIHNDAAGTATLIDLGTNFPANTTRADVYFLRMWGNSTALNYIVERYDSVGDVLHQTSGVIVTDLPATSVVVVPRIWVSNNATILQPALMVNRITISAL